MGVVPEKCPYCGSTSIGVGYQIGGGRLYVDAYAYHSRTAGSAPKRVARAAPENAAALREKIKEETASAPCRFAVSSFYHLLQYRMQCSSGAGGSKSDCIFSSSPASMA